MPTKIILIHKTTREEKEVSTEEFALVRKEIGVKGKYVDYELDYNENSPTNSFRQFRDPEGVNNFLPQIVEALKNPNCFGPSFKSLQKALSTKETADKTTIITARGHNPESILEGLEYLKSKGLIKCLPPVENIYPVSNPKFKATAANPSDKKLEILLGLIDKVNESVKSGEMATFGFSDDDAGTYKIVQEKIQQCFSDGRWSNVKVVLYFTGKEKEKAVFTNNRDKLTA